MTRAKGKKPVKLTEQEQQIVRLYESGMFAEDIARDINRTNCFSPTSSGPFYSYKSIIKVLDKAGV